MAAPKDNHNAVGNSGGKSLQDRELAAEVRSLALKELRTILMTDKMTELKQQVILKLASSVLPRLNEITGADGEALPFTMIVNQKPSETPHS